MLAGRQKPPPANVVSACTHTAVIYPGLTVVPNEYVLSVLVANPVALGTVRESHCVRCKTLRSCITAVDDISVGGDQSFLDSNVSLVKY